MCQKNKVFIFNQLKNINRLENKKSVHFRTLCPKVNVRLFAVVRKAHSETSAFTYFGGDGDGTIQTFDDGLTNT